MSSKGTDDAKAIMHEKLPWDKDLLFWKMRGRRAVTNSARPTREPPVRSPSRPPANVRRNPGTLDKPRTRTLYTNPRPLPAWASHNALPYVGYRRDHVHRVTPASTLRTHRLVPGDHLAAVRRPGGHDAEHAASGHVVAVVHRLAGADR